ncbi:ABC transporter substrate-binding protein [Phycisphaerales bacterium AB-hyl4]|uniref:ABC transporter substrate-binding protein n=1 Tax=Natronomicrosphaera hydrolytica TaxID=3242702 RepID=A0ABV4U9X3_9BACT
MDNRFGFRDFVFCVMLVAFIVTVILAMIQMQRIEERLARLNETAGNQTRDLTRLDDRMRTAERQQQALPSEIARELARVLGERPTRGDGDGDTQAEGDDDLAARLTAGFGEAAIEAAEYEAGDVDPFEKLKAVKQNEDYAYGDRLMQVFAQPPDRLTPIISADAYASMIQGYVLESLVERDPDTLEWTPLIARDWEIIDNADEWRAFVEERVGGEVSEEDVRAEPGFAELEGNEEAQAEYVERRLEEGRRAEDVVREDDVPAAITIRFRIREGVRFSDGEPLTADDVVFTYNWIMNPNVEAPRLRVYYEPIKEVEKISDLEVAFHFREPYFRAMDFAGGMQILPEHFYSRFSARDFNRHPALLMGSGPYRLPSPEGRRPQPGVPIELVRNERYWGEQPGFDRLIWRLIEQDSAREQAFLNREVDAFPATPEQYDRLRNNERVTERSQRFEFLRPNAGYNYIGWNQQRRGEDTPFADVRVRRALTMLLDRERLADDVYRGYAQVISGPFSILSPQSNPEIEPWPYDSAAARELLREAGYEDRNGDGVIQKPNGEPFGFTLNYPAGSETYQQLAMTVRDSFRRAGIEAEARPLEWQVLIERLKSTRDFDAITLGWTGSIEGDPFQIFHSSTIPPPGDNATSYSNPELDRLMEQARMTTDEDERRAMWHEVHRILHEDQPYTFLVASQSLLFYDERIRNIKRTQIGLTPPMEWYVPAELQRR